MSKRPAYYAAPLRSRKQIVDFLADHTRYDRDEALPLAWNVKLYGLDLDFDHLIEVYRNSGEYPRDARWLDYPEFLTPAKGKYEENEDNLFDSAVEAARRNIEDGEVTLWKGDTLAVSYEFHGRSGGWLVMTSFMGDKLGGMWAADFREWLTELDYNKLRNLYELVVQNDHDFARKQAIAEVEYQAASLLFDIYCSDVPRPDKTQAELVLA